MSEIIKVSQGLQFYFENGEQQAAIDQIISQKSVPQSLSWSDVEQFNDAQLSAHSTQVDYWAFLNEVWKSTWGKVLSQTKFKEVDATSYKKMYSLEYVWNNYLYKSFNVNGSTLLTCCYATGEGGVSLGFSVLDEKEFFDVSTELKLSDSWLMEQGEEHERWTKTKLLPIRAQVEINLDELSKLANEVMLKLEIAM